VNKTLGTTKPAQNKTLSTHSNPTPKPTITPPTSSTPDNSVPKPTTTTNNNNANNNNANNEHERPRGKVLPDRQYDTITREEMRLMKNPALHGIGGKK